MPDWRVKAVTQRTLDRLPASHHLSYALQRWVTRSALLRPQFLRRKVEQAGRHLEHWSATGAGAPPARVIELGTGWFPVVTLSLSLAGCAEVVTVDRSPLLRPANVARTLRALRDGVNDGWVPETLGHLDEARLRALSRLAERDEVPAQQLAELGVRVMVADAAKLSLPDGSCGFFVSNNTLEHIGREPLRGILAEFHRLCAPDGAMSHFIDMSDHYSHFDGTISPLNFLRFDERRWRRWDNGIVPQNRMRLSEYRALHEQAGFRVLSEEVTLAELADLERVPIAPEFAGREPDDLRATYVWMVSAPAAATPAATAPPTSAGL